MWMFWILTMIFCLLAGYVYGKRPSPIHDDRPMMRKGLGVCSGCGDNLMHLISEDPMWWQCATPGCGISGQGDKKPEWL